MPNKAYVIGFYGDGFVGGRCGGVRGWSLATDAHEYTRISKDGRDTFGGTGGTGEWVVKEQGLDWLAGVGGHHVDVAGIFGRLRLRGPRDWGLRGRRLGAGGRGALGALLQEVFQVAHGFGEGILEAGALRGKLFEQGHLAFGIHLVQVDDAFEIGEAHEEPLLHGQLFDVQFFGAALGLPIVFEFGAELVELFGVFEGQDGIAGTQSVFEGVESDLFLALGGFGTGGVLRVAFVGLLLFCRNHTNGFSFRPENRTAGIADSTDETGAGWSGCLF